MNIKFWQKSILIVVLAIFLSCNAACTPIYEGRPTAFPTEAATNTIEPSPTYTLTPAPTATLTPTPTLTPSPTIEPSPTATSTPTPIPTQLAGLPVLSDGSRIVNWDYAYITGKENREDGGLISLSAMVAFQLMDRGIHSEVINVLGDEVTVFYLRVRHEYNDMVSEVKLVLTGVYGSGLDIRSLPADGSTYISYHTRRATDLFEPWKLHQEWSLPASQREPLFTSIRLAELEDYLRSLPDDVILLADHPIILPRDDWNQVYLDMDSLSASAARFAPFFAFNELNQMTGQTTMATLWQNHLLSGADIPADQHNKMVYSAEYLVFVTP